jgi:hypothetical protein
MNSSRPLTPYQFFEVVQIEYICAVLRSRIYVAKKDKEYWSRVAEGKKRKVEEIATRNHLPSIFTDSDLNDTLEKRVFIEGSHPAFVYRDEKHKVDQEYYDLYFYYGKGREVRFLHEDEMVVGKITQYKVFGKTIKVEYKGEELTLNTSDVSRIL